MSSSFSWSSYFFSWSSLWKSLLSSLGLDTTKQATLLVLGLDNAGKTTFLHSLSSPQQQQQHNDASSSSSSCRVFPPTDRPKQNQFVFGRIHFQAWDLGGHEAVRHVWQDYYCVQQDRQQQQQQQQSFVSAILFLVDAADEERLEEAGYELDHLLATTMMQDDDDDHEGDDDEDKHAAKNTSTTTSSSSIPVAILCNKCDLPTAASSQEILEKMDYTHLQTMHGHDRISVFRISVWQGQGYEAVFGWLKQFL
jgi:GTP-binding protein SAR1